MQNNKIYVGNIPYKATEAELKITFEEFGDITDLKIITDRYTGESRGFGFITYSDSAAAQKAIGFNGQDFQGKKLTVNIAKDKERGGRQGGGGGRRGERQGGWNNRY